MNHDHSSHDDRPKTYWGSRYAVGLIVMGAIALYFLLTEHQAHFFSALPFLLLLACPFMHLFMHHGHGGHGGHGVGEDHSNSNTHAAEPPPSSKPLGGGKP